MDFNNLSQRLERVYASIGEMTSSDFQKDIKWTPGEFDVNFGATNESSDENRVVSAISAIADLKDNLKNKMTSLGLDSKLVEEEINNNLPLQLITDLDNQHKHGYPLTKSRRSKMDPEIKEVTSAVRFPVGKDGTLMEFDLVNEKVSAGEGAEAKTIINAEIRDYGGNFICTLDRMVDDAMSIWETFITSHSLK